MKVYLAAAFERQLEILRYRNELEAVGHTVTSRWNDPAQRHGGLVSMQGATMTDIERWAIEDIADLTAASTIINFTGQGNRGGRHVEFGIGIALNKQLVIVGPLEHVFHYLPQVQQLTTPAQFLSWATNQER
jgi:hypothetical protein